MKKTCFVLLLTFFTTVVACSQTLTLENVYKMYLRNSGAIKENSEVKGYFFFYVSDKIDKRTYQYTLRITDSSLKKLKDVVFEGNKDVEILESSFNGSDICFSFFSAKDKTITTDIYGSNGSKKFSYTRELSRKEVIFIGDTYIFDIDNDNTYTGLYPIEGVGFIANLPSREKKDFTFQLDFMGSANKKQWSYIPPMEGKVFTGDVLGLDNGRIYLSVSVLKSRTDQKPDIHLVSLDLATGKQQTDVVLEDDEKIIPINIVKANQKSYIVGEYFSENANVAKDRSKGIAFSEIGADGKLKNTKKQSWVDDLGKFIDVKDNGKIKRFGSIYIHSLTQMANGDIYAAGEGLAKQVSVLGIANTILGGDASRLLDVDITDMIVIKFDNSFTMKDAKIYPKRHTTIGLPDNYGFLPLASLGKFIKYYWGGFDYEYTQINKPQTTVSIAYSDWIKEKKGYKGSTFNSINIKEGEITIDKINTKSDATYSRVLPSKAGYVLIIDYYRKKKLVEIHTEKLN